MLPHRIAMSLLYTPPKNSATTEAVNTLTIEDSTPQPAREPAENRLQQMPATDERLPGTTEAFAAEFRNVPPLHLLEKASQIMVRTTRKRI